MANNHDGFAEAQNALNEQEQAGSSSKKKEHKTKTDQLKILSYNVTQLATEIGKLKKLYSDQVDSVWKIIKNHEHLFTYTFLSQNQYGELRHNLCLKYGLPTLDGHKFPAREEIGVLDQLILIPYLYLLCGKPPTHIGVELSLNRPVYTLIVLAVTVLHSHFVQINKTWTMADLLRLERAMREKHGTQGIAWVADFVRFTIILDGHARKGLFVADASGAFTHAQLMFNRLNGSDCESFQDSDFYKENIQREAYAINCTRKYICQDDHKICIGGIVDGRINPNAKMKQKQLYCPFAKTDQDDIVHLNEKEMQFNKVMEKSLRVRIEFEGNRKLKRFIYLTRTIYNYEFFPEFHNICFLLCVQMTNATVDGTFSVEEKAIKTRKDTPKSKEQKEHEKIMTVLQERRDITRKNEENMIITGSLLTEDPKYHPDINYLKEYRNCILNLTGLLPNDVGDVKSYAAFTTKYNAISQTVSLTDKDIDAIIQAEEEELEQEIEDRMGDSTITITKREQTESLATIHEYKKRYQKK